MNNIITYKGMHYLYNPKLKRYNIYYEFKINNCYVEQHFECGEEEIYLFKEIHNIFEKDVNRFYWIMMHITLNLYEKFDVIKRDSYFN